MERKELQVIEQEDRRLVAEMSQMAQVIIGLGQEIRALKDVVTRQEIAIRKMTKVTPTQANALTKAMHDRAAQVCGMYRLTGKEADVLKEIRKAFRASCGVRGVKELPMDSYAAAMKMIVMWEDYKILKGMKTK